MAQWSGLAQDYSQRTVRIAILSSFTIDQIKPYIQTGSLERYIWADVFIPGYNQFAQQILQPESDLYSFRPDVCFVQVPPEALINGVETTGLMSEQVEPLVQSVRDFIVTFRENCQADLVVSNFAVPTRFPYSFQSDGAATPYISANQQLEQIAKELPGVHVLDYDSLTSYHGKESVADHRWRHIARMDLNEKFLPKLANQMLAYVLALRGLGRKCILLDLDDTLWGGVVGEEGLTGIRLGPDYPGSAFVEFQQSLLALHRRGILLALASKNNHSDALEVLANHPSMVLRPAHFSAMRINWRDKCENVEAIAAELNLGLESIVFIDDNPAERELMRRLRPEILTPEWPVDVVYYRPALESLCDFESPAVTTEDLNRGAMYAAETRREEAKKRSGSLEEYLFGLNLEISIEELAEKDLDRFHQLVNKTNQFNLTTRRYSSAEVRSFIAAENVAAYVLRNQDIFGDNGLVGVAVVMSDDSGVENKTWRIDSFLMSCRVLGRTIEVGFLKYILEGLKARGSRDVIGEFIPTKKNAMVKNFYPEAGFEPSDDVQNADSARWVRELASYVAPSLPWLKVNN